MQFNQFRKGCRGILYLNLYEIVHSPKVFVILFSYIAVLERTVFPLVQIAKETDYALNTVEAFIAVSNSTIESLIIPITLFVLLCDFPKNNNKYTFCVFRSGRITWYWGNILSSMVVSFSYIVSLLLVTMVGTMQVSFWYNKWSLFTSLFREYYPEKAIELGDRVVIGTELYMHYTPLEAVVLTVVLNVLLGISIAMIQTLTTLWNKKIIGIILNAIILVIGWVMLLFKQSLMWVFPFANSRLGWRNEYMLAKQIVPEWVSFLYYILLLSIIFIISYRQLNLYNFSMADETD